MARVSPKRSIRTLENSLDSETAITRDRATLALIDRHVDAANAIGIESRP
jgi:hypothetical protein